MDCFFGSTSLPDGNDLKKTAVVAFTIPELGIRFKAPFDAIDSHHSDFASFLALLEFIDGNQKYFNENTYQIYGNNLKVVNQINLHDGVESRYVPLMEKALKYRKKYRFSLEWVPSDDNPVNDLLFD